ncbi:MAG: DUF3854 domain-containing protein [Gemmataceae bacterium]
MNKLWEAVHRTSPCPICAKTTWCSVKADGTVALCRRIQEGADRTKADKNGTEYYVHTLTDGPRTPAPPPFSRTAKQKSRDTHPNLLHQVYGALLGELQLIASHRANLRKRGLTDNAINKGLYRTLPETGRSSIAKRLWERFGDKVMKAPGIVQRDKGNGPYLTLAGHAGLVIPCRDREGRIVALKIRLDGPDRKGPKYTYVTSKKDDGPGPGTPIHIPLGMPQKAEVVRVTEGELKADVIFHKTDVPTISVPGVSIWRAALPILDAMACKTVRLAFDADAWENPNVARCLVEFARALGALDYEVELEQWDPEKAKGLDDCLAAGYCPEVLKEKAVEPRLNEIAEAAGVADELNPSQVLDRLPEVLKGGAQALFDDGELLNALAQQKGNDPAGFAANRALVKDHKISLQDFNRVIKELSVSHSVTVDSDDVEYFADDNCTYRNKPTQNGPIPVRLSNFTARIVEEVMYDDGAEEKGYFWIEGTLAGGHPLRRIDVPIAEFSTLNWVTSEWGARPIVNAGVGAKDHLRAAIQFLSPDIQSRTVYTHIGWHEIDGRWVYLHGGGGIGSEGKVNTSVDLLGNLGNYSLPDLPMGTALREAVQASLRLLTLGPPCIMFALLASIYRAVLGNVDFSIFLTGPSGTFKSELAALAQQHFGPAMNARNLPDNWSSTDNALEGITFLAKDAILVVDDFCPLGTSRDVQQLHRKADRVLRAQGNHSGRGRMTADGTLRAERPPRGMILATGEDVPCGLSLRARLVVLPVSPGDIGAMKNGNNAMLAQCQQDAENGLYAKSLAAFLVWMAPQLTDIQHRLNNEKNELRQQMSTNCQHARTPGNVADLALGFRYLLDFAVSVDAIAHEEREEHWESALKAFAEIALLQQEQIVQAEPAQHFIALLQAALSGGYGHLIDEHGGAPPEPRSWGWQSELSRPSSDFPEGPCRPKGKCFGWLIEGQLYLDPENSYAVAQTVAKDQGDSLAIQKTTLGRRLHEKLFLASREETRQRCTVRKMIQGRRREVLHICLEVFQDLRQTGPTSPQEDDDRVTDHPTETLE